MNHDSKLVQAVIAETSSIDNKRTLSCVDAFKLAGRLDLDVSEIGRICNGQKIKIRKCQLGCFR